MDDFLAAIMAVKAKQKYSLQRPLFAHDAPVAFTAAQSANTLDCEAITAALGIDSLAVQRAIRRLEKAMGGTDEEIQTERGVREL